MSNVQQKLDKKAREIRQRERREAKEARRRARATQSPVADTRSHGDAFSDSAPTSESTDASTRQGGS